MLFTKRANTLRSHRGEVCFPGGRRDKNETIEETALREAAEEIGLPVEAVDVWGITPVKVQNCNFTQNNWIFGC